MKDYDKYEKDYYYAHGPLLTEIYSLNNEYHRLVGPAYYWYYPSGILGFKVYYLNGLTHRIDGPAVIKYDTFGNLDFEEYYFNNFIYMRMPRLVERMRKSSCKTKRCKAF